MKRIRPLLAIAASAVAVTLGVTGCDSSPVAASVNGTFIKQTALQQRMREVSSDPVVVADLRKEGLTPEGSAPNTFSSTFAAATLSQLVQSRIVSDQVSRDHHHISAADLAAARSIQEITYDGWTALPASVRKDYATFSANLASYLTVDTSQLADLQTAYQNKRAYFFSRVCTRTITVAVTGANGGINYPASLARANQIEEQDYSGTPSTSAAATGGAPPTTTPSSPTTPSTTATTAPASSTSSSTAPATTTPAGAPPTVPSATTTPSSTTGSSTSSTTVPASTTTTAPSPAINGGAVLCYTPTALEGQGAAFFNQVLGLAPGHALLPRRTSYGYQILAVDSRRFQPFGPAVARAIQFFALQQQQQGPDIVKLNQILTSAKVRINPAFGTWDKTTASIDAPGLPVTIERKMSGQPLAP